ncbi:MAG: hypothetical protein ABH821_04380 [archaeon]
MALNAQEEFVSFMQQYPEFYVIVNSESYMVVLEAVEKKGLSLEDLHSILDLKHETLNPILDSLYYLKVIEKLKVGGKTIFYSTDIGKKLLAKFRKAKKELNIS